MAAATEIAVEVVYALPGAQVLVRLSLAPGAIVGEAIRQSGLLQRYPQINIATVCAGVFGNKVALDSRLNDGDRVEIYRPLTVDPKEARRRRVALRTAGKMVV
jgi:putative ubiquitin-RnfH superfamily antitoxin RatB of RatAB toxin-antitoxin module